MSDKILIMTFTDPMMGLSYESEPIIYESEESISDMPKGFNLFSVNEISTLPLNLAYKAAQLVDKTKADLFLYNLRYATIVDCRPTTRINEILKVVRQSNIDIEEFLTHYHNGNARAALNKDLRFAQNLNLRTLPSYLINFGEENKGS